MKKVILVNLLFAAALAYLLANKVTSNHVWLVFMTGWCLAEAFLAKDKNVKPWQWGLVLGGLCLIDIAVVFYFK